MEAVEKERGNKPYSLSSKNTNQSNEAAAATGLGRCREGKREGASHRA